MRVASLDMKAGWIVVALAGTAYADERGAAVTVGGLGQLEVSDRVDAFGDPEIETYGSVRATIGWEPPPTPYPMSRGIRAGGAVVPELVVGALLHESTMELLLGAGVRAELRLVQREGGWLRIDSRSAIYVAARGMVVGEDRDVVLEGVFGDHFSLGDSPVRFGFELGVTQRRSDGMEDRAGALVQVYLGYGPPPTAPAYPR